LSNVPSDVVDQLKQVLAALTGGGFPQWFLDLDDALKEDK
jgi:hypothetical protein